jgi:hypothetical protein
VSLAIDPYQVRMQDDTLVSSLRRPNGMGRGWGLVPTMLIGAASFGTLPLLAWPIRLRDLFAGEAARLMEISRVAVADPTAPNRSALVRAARQTGPFWLFWVLPVLAASFLITGAAMFLLSGGHAAFDHLVRLTYRAGQTAAWDDPLTTVQSVFGVWSAVLIGGYLLLFLHVQIHFSAVRRFLVRFNGILAISGIETIRLPRRSIVPGLIWLAGGVAMTAFGAWWAIPMVLAGSIQRRGAFQMHRQLGNDLADRVDALLQVTTLPRQRCQTTRCHALLRADSRFCGRCGGAVNPLYSAGSIWA